MHMYIMYICTYLQVHTYVHTYIHAYIHIYIHTYIHIYIHTYIYMYMYITYIWGPYIHVHVTFVVKHGLVDALCHFASEITYMYMYMYIHMKYGISGSRCTLVNLQVLVQL